MTTRVRPALTRARRAAWLAGLALLVVIAGICACCLGPEGIQTPGALWPLRASRVALALVVGAGLSASGAALQAALRNALADPFVLGVSGGAALGAALAVACSGAFGLASSGAALSALGLHGAAVVGAAAASTLLALFLARDRSGRGDGALLVGVVLNAFSWALVASLRAIRPAADTQLLSLWLVGSIGYPTTTTLWSAAVATGLGVIVLVSQAGALAVVRAGDDEATRLGIDARRTRAWTYGAASLVVGVSVAATGIVGFVGLFVPHALRRMAGPDERLIIPGSALLGAALLALFDGCARWAFVWLSTELPVGALCALLGAPALALLLWRDLGPRGEDGRERAS